MTTGPCGALARIGTPHALDVLRNVASVGPERLREEATRKLASRR